MVGQTTPEYDIRRSVPGDYMAMRAVNRAAWEQAYDHIFTPEEIHALFDNELKQETSWVDRRIERIATLVAEADDKIVGYCGCELLHNGDGEIATLYVLPEYQGHGIGSGLWSAGLGILREAGCRRLWVWVMARARAVEFYEDKGCGLTETGSYRIGNHEEVTHGYTLDLMTDQPASS
jgi:ribosomal protein S18 acetylase RimI-like enzyme